MPLTRTTAPSDRPDHPYTGRIHLESPRNTDCPSKLASCEPLTKRRAQPITGIRQHAAKAHTGRDGTIDLRQSHFRFPLRHRLNALAIARTDQSRHVERAHLSPCFVTQPIQKRLEPTPELVSPIRPPASHGRPLQKADHP